MTEYTYRELDHYVQFDGCGIHTIKAEIDGLLESPGISQWVKDKLVLTVFSDRDGFVCMNWGWHEPETNAERQLREAAAEAVDRRLYEELKKRFDPSA